MSDTHFIAVMLAPSPGITASWAVTASRYDAAVGMMVLNPADVESRVHWNSSRENMVIAIRPDSLMELAASEFDLGSVQLQPPAFGTIDPWALQLAERLKLELQQGRPINELYFDSIITLFGVHVPRSYTACRKQAPRIGGELSPRVARRVQEYLAENFARQLSVAELASICGLSPSRFSHCFTRTFGRQPHRFVLGMRVDFAERLLRETDIPYAEIAYLSGFSSQSHLITAMKKLKGTIPRLRVVISAPTLRLNAKPPMLLRPCQSRSPLFPS